MTKILFNKLIQWQKLICTFVIIGLVSTIGSKGDDVTLFRACFGTILAIFACAQICIATQLFRNRHNSLIELFQPVSLGLFSSAGAIATLCCFTFSLPEYDVNCAIRQPIILVCISFMGEFGVLQFNGYAMSYNIYFDVVTSYVCT